MMGEWLRRVKRFLKREKWDEERTREIEAYLEIESDENVARGMDPDEAHYAALRKLGNATLIREEIYHMNSLGFLQTLWQDLRFGARLLRLNAGFAIAAILSLALGIGANTAIFQLLDAVTLRTLPVTHAEQLAEVYIDQPHGRTGNFSSRYSELTNPMWEQIRDHQEGFSTIAAWSPTRFNISPKGQVRPVAGIFASGAFFQVAEVEPLLGRFFSPADDQPGCGTPGAVISYSFWQREYGGDPSALGRIISVESHPVGVIGIAPQGFTGLEVGHGFDVALPVCSEPVIRGEDTQLARRDGWWLAVTGRLKPGWTLAKASAQLRTISPAIFEATLPPRFNADSAKHYLGYKLGAFPGGLGRSDLRRDSSNPLYLLLGLAGLVLLIACANLANLMLARASAREKEMSVRLAIGASRGRLIRQLLAESLLLAGIGAVLGALLARWLGAFVVSMLDVSSNTPFLVNLSLDWRVLGFTAGLAVLTCVLFGLTPAIQATQVAPGAVLKANGRGLTSSRERFGLRRSLVVAQVGLSLVLLFGALLFSRSLRNLMTLDAGFRQDGILVTYLDLRNAKIPKANRYAYKRQIVDQIGATPGVDAVAAVYNVPIGGNSSNDNVLSQNSDTQTMGTTWNNWVTPNFFATLGTPVLQGRDFTEKDNLAAPKVAVVNQAFVQKFLSPGSPLGQTFRLEPDAGKAPPRYLIVGVVKNAKYADMHSEFAPVAYFPIAQDEDQDEYASVVAHSNGPLGALVSAERDALAQMNPAIQIEFKTLPETVRASLTRDRLMATLSGFFGVLATLLATVGLYGVISYMVARRRNEIGIRMALGAGRASILRMVMGEAGLLLAIGLAAGAVLSLMGARAASSLLFGLNARDPLTLALGVAILVIVAAVASYLPAQRAASLDPMQALRDE
ncbi:MAG TPA: ABC transporter permease [Candidatus Acidoferrales bacterium]|nr:ABC transporter permease [Candidatus Acidoferrales bacterium]